MAPRVEPHCRGASPSGTSVVADAVKASTVRHRLDEVMAELPHAKPMHDDVGVTQGANHSGARPYCRGGRQRGTDGFVHHDCNGFSAGRAFMLHSLHSALRPLLKGS